MSFFNSRGVFLQLMQPGPSEPNTLVSMQLARKELAWDAQTSTESELLVDSIMVTATSKDGGKTFTIDRLNQDVDRDGVIGDADKAKLAALAKAYASIINP
ncbi:hypothetical protein [Pseudomonas sp. P1.31]|jgi:hypothetical protein|uniref:hypothetical protein n=1 Tax=Pseudomonas sp. P1.31 TaxID=1699311 RepID=UPI00069F8716|nr:hypothetical protein [Pseudomonas sp. P1.31]